jgi:tetratricopeptide (TPR) repeat protein
VPEQERYEAARELYEKGDPDAAADILEPVVEAEPDNTAARLLLARSYSRMRLGEEAVGEIDPVLEREPENVEALTLRGAEHYFADELREAADKLQQAIDLDPDTLEARARLAQVLTDEKQFTEAAEVLDQAEERAEGRTEGLPMVRMARVYLLMQKRDHAGALQLIEENEELWKASPYVHATVRSNQAIIKARQRDFGAAKELLIDALDSDPYFYSARSLLGQIAAMQRDHQLAVDQLSQVVESGVPVSPHVQYALASSLMALGRSDEANEHYREALKSGLSGMPAITARLAVAVPNLKVRLALLGVVVVLLALLAFRAFPPILAGAIVLMFGVLGYQVIKGGR